MQGLSGTTVFHFDGNPTYTLPQRAAGGAGTFFLNVTQINDSPTLQATVQVMAPSGSSYTNALSFSDITSVALHTLDIGAGYFSAGWFWRIELAFAAGADATDAVTFTYGMVPRTY